MCLQPSATTTPMATYLSASRATGTGNVREATRACNVAQPCWCSTGDLWDALYRQRRTATSRRRRCLRRASWPTVATSRKRKRTCHPVCHPCRKARNRFPCDRAVEIRSLVEAGRTKEATNCPFDERGPAVPRPYGRNDRFAEFQKFSRRVSPDSLRSRRCEILVVPEESSSLRFHILIFPNASNYPD